MFSSKLIDVFREAGKASILAVVPFNPTGYIDVGNVSYYMSHII